MRTAMPSTAPGHDLRAAIVVAAAGSAGAGLIHAAAAGSHEGSRSLVWLFAACAAAQLGWAAVVVLVPSRRALFVGAGINGAALVTWFLSRTVGLPIVDALAEPEAIGTQDLLAAGLAAVALAATLLAITQPIALRSLTNGWSAVIVFSAVALAVPGLAAGHTHGGHDHLASTQILAGAAHQHDAGGGHQHGAPVAGLVADNHAGDHHAVATAAGGTTSATHSGHGATTTAADAHHGTTPSGSPATQHDHSPTPTDPSQTPTTPGPPHVHPPTGPPTPVDPPHVHPPTPTGPIVTVDDPRLSAAQQRAAGNLLLTTVQAMAVFPTVESVEAAGYQSIGDAVTGFEHFVNWTYLTDGIELDPQRIESVVARVNSDGSRTVASGMYILTLGKTMADVPDIAGTLTTWHDHQDLCWTPTSGGGYRVTGIAVNGTCPNGGFNVATPPMLHVWLTPQDCGPFAGIEGLHGDTCVHAH